MRFLRSTRMAALCACTAALSACATSGGTTAITPSSVYTGDHWTADCEDEQHDAYGKFVDKANCWAMVTYFGDITKDLSQSIGVAEIFRVDVNGPRLLNNPDLDADSCGAQNQAPRRMAVDGKEIDQMPMQARIDAVLGGQKFTREIDRGWPYCNVYDEMTTLGGARAAYDDMMAKWKARGGR